MLFRIRLDLLQPERGNPRQVNASLQYENVDFLKSHLGTFMYYHFLREFFEDISKFHRDGDIAFCKKGIGDLCIRWNISCNENQGTIKKKIIEGLEHTSITERQKYWDKYSIGTSLSSVKDGESYWNSNTFNVSIEAKFNSLHKAVVNSDYVSEILG